jgi:hypothetical protein
MQPEETIEYEDPITVTPDKRAKPIDLSTPDSFETKDETERSDISSPVKD